MNKKKQHLTSTPTATNIIEENAGVLASLLVISSFALALLSAQPGDSSSSAMRMMNQVGYNDWNDAANRFCPYQALQWTDQFEE
jgi:hypothetical protein